MSVQNSLEKWYHIFSNYAQHGYTAAVHARDFEEIRDDLAIALEEVALMEAERVAARVLIEHAFMAKRGDTSYIDKLHAWATAGAATDAYRKEHGL